MGLSKSKTKTKTTSNETGTMTPTNPQWVQDSVQGHTQQINDFAKRDPYSMVAGSNANQTKAWDVMGGYKPSGPNLADRISLAGPATFNAQTYSAPRLGDAALSESVKFGGVKLGDANTYSAPEIAALREAQASQGAQYMDSYRNPYTNDVVNTSLAGFDDNAGRVRAQQAAQGAANGAFGGSRFALREAQTEGELGRERASLEAGLRSNAFNTAAGYGMADADRFGQVSMGNAQMGNQRNQAQAGLYADASRFGADARNQFALSQAGFDAQTGMFNAGQETQNNQFNAGSRNQFALGQANLDASAGQFNANAANQAGMFNAGNENQFALSQAQMDQQNSMFNAGQTDQAQQRELASIGMLGDMGNQQWQVEQARAQAPLQQMQALSGMHAANPYALFSGRNMTGNMTGTNVSQSKPGLFQIMQMMGNTGANAYAGGMGG